MTQVIVPSADADLLWVVETSYVVVTDFLGVAFIEGGDTATHDIYDVDDEIYVYGPRYARHYADDTVYFEADAMWFATLADFLNYLQR